MIFWSKKQENSKDFEERLTKLEKQVRKLENECIDLATTLEVYRNKILKKVKLKAEDMQEEEKPKDLYNGMLLKEI